MWREIASPSMLLKRSSQRFLTSSRQVKSSLISDSGDNITDMCLMSMCDYQILANSTYSWWGAWLSNSKNVIAPKLWFGPDGQDPKDVYVDRWEYLDV